MNAQARRAIRAAALLAAAILLASCCRYGFVSPEPYLYAPPLEGEPAAWIKLQYVYYTGVRGGPVTMRVRMFIREGQEEKFRPAYIQSLGSVSKTENPKVPMHATRIRPIEDTAIQMRLGFEWTGPELMPTIEVGPPDHQYEAGCSAMQQFNPEPDKVYLVSYTSLPRRCGPECWLPDHCQVAIFLETPTGIGTFKLEPVGEPYVE
jgi:hypothetical protein